MVLTTLESYSSLKLSVAAVATLFLKFKVFKKSFYGKFKPSIGFVVVDQDKRFNFLLLITINFTKICC